MLAPQPSDDGLLFARRPMLKGARFAGLLFTVTLALAPGCDQPPLDNEEEQLAYAARCPSGQTICGRRCVDIRTDRMNCGACGRACSAGQICSAGACRAGCPQGQTSCAGVCRDLASDPANCGGCGRLCPD